MYVLGENPDGGRDCVPQPKSGMRHYWKLTFLFVALGLSALSLDLTFATPANTDAVPGDLLRVIQLSEIFAHGFGIFVVGVGIFLLVPNKRHFIPRIVACAVLPSVTVQLTKLFFSRDRPVKYLQPDLSVIFPSSIGETWHGFMATEGLNATYMTQSFPSAHTATVVGLAIGMCWVFPRGRNLFVFLAFLASIQRIASLAHWSSDVCFGAALAFMMAGALTHNWGLGFWLGRLETKRELQLDTQDDKASSSNDAEISDVNRAA